MIELKGKYNTAKVFTDNLEATAKDQIVNLLNQAFVKDSKIRVMPDAHAGAGCTIGTTMTIKDKVVPNLVGVDIGCGMETIALKEKEIDLDRLDKIIHTGIPAGFQIRKKPHPFLKDINLIDLKIADKVNIKRAELSVGTLGGGNHFIEVGENEQGRLYLIVHSGSRNLGKQIADYYQKAAAASLAKKKIKIERSLAYTEGKLYKDYLHDMEIAQNYADINRKAMVDVIMERMNLAEVERFTTVHNYIDQKTMILRKGAISAQAGEKVLIPLNMRDGSLICIGKGNPDWNYSAPHGAGRILSRRAARERIKLKDFKETMEGVYSTTIGRATLDEAPFAYKPMEEIIRNMGDSVEITEIVKPIYNFKAED